MEENSLDKLLKAYQQTNDRLMNTELLNKKILKELIDVKIRKSVNRIRYNDLGGSLAGLFLAVVFGWATYFCRTKLDLLIFAVVTDILFAVMIFVFLRYYQWSFSPVIYIEKDFKATLQQIKIHIVNLRKQRIYGIIIMIPMLLTMLPSVWWTFRGIYYLDIFRRAVTSAPGYIGGLVALLVLSVWLTWKLYDWMYFNDLKKIEDNIHELEE